MQTCKRLGVKYTNGLYYLNARYYNPEWGRFINADTTDVLDGGNDHILENNLFAYCLNNPVNMSDDDGQWPKWVKVAIGVAATVAAVAITVSTGGAAAPLLIGVATSTASSAAVSAVTHRVNTGSWKGAGKAAMDGAADGFMWGGIGAFAGSSISAVKAVSSAKKGIAIGENMSKRVTPLAKKNNLSTYKGLKGYKAIEKVVGKSTASKLGMAHNKAWITRQTKLGARVVDFGPSGSSISSPFYAMERRVVAGYWNYVKAF